MPIAVPFANDPLPGYAFACHTGAAIEGLCYTAGASNSSSTSQQFYFNYTAGQSQNVSGVPTTLGTVVWKLPYTSGSGGISYEFEGMGLQYQPNSNVAAPLFGPGLSFASPFSVGFDSNSVLFGASYIDDSTFVAGVNPSSSAGATANYNFYLCWQYFTGYYYQSVGWVQTQPPHNPTCEAISVTRQMITYM
jgi:hypothetical protein